MTNIQSIILYLVVFFFSYLLIRIGIGSKNRIAVFLGLGIVVMLGFLRYGLGGDYPSYLELYSFFTTGVEMNIHAAMYAEEVEPMTAWMAQLSYVLTGTPLLYFGIPWIATVILTYLGIRRILNDSSPERIALAWVTILPIITALGFNQVRQTLAAAMLFFAYSYLMKPQFAGALKYVGLAFIAVTTHFSAMFMIVVYLLMHKFFRVRGRQSKRRIASFIVLGLSAITVLVLLGFIFRETLLGQFSDVRYIQEFYRLMLPGSDAEGLLFGIFDVRPENLIVLSVFLVPILLFFRNRYTGDWQIIAFCALGLIMSYLSLFILNGERLSQYFIFFAPIAVVCMMRGRYSIAVLYAAFIFIIIMFFGWQTVTRYNTIFHQDVDLNIVTQRRHRALFSQTLCWTGMNECKSDELYDADDSPEQIYYDKHELWRLRK